MRRAQAGDARATETVLERLACVPAMLRSRHRRLGAPLGADELEDVEQETLTALWTKLGLFNGIASLETWAYRFAMNELLRAADRKLRRARLRPEDRDARLDELEAPVATEPGEEHLALELALGRLPPAVADVIRARHFDDRSFEDLARVSREPVSTVKARYYRGLCELKRLVAQRPGEEK